MFSTDSLPRPDEIHGMPGSAARMRMAGAAGFELLLTDSPALTPNPHQASNIFGRNGATVPRDCRLNDGQDEIVSRV
jgi:hypothetical protein